MTTNYCSQNNGDCKTCSLVNYGRDCHNNQLQTCTICGERTPSREHSQAIYDGLGFAPAVDTGKKNICDKCFVSNITRGTK
jgi:hypothetical protein